MKTLVLSGYDVVIDYDKVRLRMKDGKSEQRYSAGDLSNLELIYMTGLSGYISMRAMRFLSHMGVLIALRYINGKPAYDMIPQLPQRDPQIKIKQFRAFLGTARMKISNDLVREKHRRSNATLKWMGAPQLDPGLQEATFSRQYFKAFGQFAEDYGYEYGGRIGKFGVLNLQATNQLNALLNLFYGYVEARLLREITLTGLDPQVSYLHESRKSKLSLAYDLVELLRADVDRLVLEMVRKKEIKSNMFQVVNSTHYLVKEPKNFIEMLDSRFTRDDYKGCVEWLLKRI